MGVLVGGFYSGGEFAPSYLGQVAGDGDVIIAEAEDSQLGAASASADSQIWVETDASQTYVRVDGQASPETTLEWYDDNGSSQGDPGTDRNVLTLGQRVDSVNIFTKNNTTISGSPNLAAIGTYTNDDKSTFFNPTNGVNYGLDMQTSASAGGPGSESEEGSFIIQITFRKAGFSDLTVEFKGRSKSYAENVT